MKRVNKFFSGLLFVLPLCLAFNVSANNRYAVEQRFKNEMQNAWVFPQGTALVEVFVKNASIYAKVKAQSKSNKPLELPEMELKTINRQLLREYPEKFILIKDLNNDKYMDIGVLKSVGYAGGLRCYSVFMYKPNFYSFSTRASKTVCSN